MVGLGAPFLGCRGLGPELLVVFTH
jgi:hypothetical protein